MAQSSSTMIGGHGDYSYAKNSALQREGLNAAENAIKEVLEQNLDLELVLSGSSTFRIVDLGCSVGPNTFLAMQTIIESVKHKINSINFQSKSFEALEFQVFFNDQTTNDFNTLFTSLPQNKTYYAAGVPGSFYDRLFTSSSIHFAFSSSSLHWLSKVPDQVRIKNSPAWNKGKIHYTDASEEVVRAYREQYEEDMEIFLKARGEEMVKGGMMVMIMPGVHDGGVVHDVGLAFCFIGSILMDIVKEGILNEDQVDSFNIPHVYPSVKQMTKAVEKNGLFSIVKMECRNARSNTKASIDIKSAIMHLRALAEGTIANHFGTHIVDEIFTRAMQRQMDFANMLYSSGIEIGVQLFAVLIRK